MHSKMKKGIAWAAAALLGLALSGVAGGDTDGLTTKGPLVIGHRGGGSGYLPDHTLEAYALGIEFGADYIELDLVATKDGHLIVRHEPNLIDTTNVATLPQFASRKRTLELDGVPVTGFFASDFTLTEIKQLRAVQPLPERGQAFDGEYQIPTLEESIQFVKRKSAEKGRRIGIYPETKHPTYHQSIGLPLEDRLLDALHRAGWNRRGAPVFIQSFETANLRYLRTRTDLPLIQLVDADDLKPDGAVALNRPYDKPYDWVVSGRSGLFSDLLTAAGLAEVRTYADGIGGADTRRTPLAVTLAASRTLRGGFTAADCAFNASTRQSSQSSLTITSRAAAAPDRSVTIAGISAPPVLLRDSPAKPQTSYAVSVASRPA